MFGFQRIGDLAWAAGDSRTRGFLLGATAGRTTLNGEGLQHEDGHSHLLSATIPNCVSYDPCFAYELAVIVQNGLYRMIENQEDVYYYITIMNENYSHPDMPKGVEDHIIKGMYQYSKASGKAKYKVQLMGSGVILREVIEAAKLLENDWGVESDVWSVTSFTELRRNALDVERHNLLNPDDEQRSFIQEQITDTESPIIASTDYMKSFSDQIANFIPNSFTSLGTDGFGRSDSREALRSFFEVDRYYVVLAALKALKDQGKIDKKIVSEAIKKYNINPSKVNPALS
jgi:pyruvate dehydrogenase E1 component